MTMGEEMLALWASRDIPMRHDFVHFDEHVSKPLRHRTAPPAPALETSDTTSDAGDSEMSELFPDTDDEWESDRITSVVGTDDDSCTPTPGSQQFPDGPFQDLCVAETLHHNPPQFCGSGPTFIDLMDCPQPCVWRTCTAPPPTIDLLESDSESILELVDDDAINSGPESQTRRWADVVDEPPDDTTSNLISHSSKVSFSPKRPTTDGKELPFALKRDFNEDTRVCTYQWTISAAAKYFNSTDTQRHSPPFDVFLDDEDVRGQIGLHPTEGSWRRSKGQGRVGLKVSVAGNVRFRVSVGSQQLNAEVNDFAEHAQRMSSETFNFKSAASGSDLVITLEVLPALEVAVKLQ